MSRPAERPRGAIDFPRAGTAIEDGVLVLSGWVAFDEGPTARVEAWFGERPLGRARLGLPRPDLAPLVPGPDGAVAGFELRAGLDDVHEGDASLRVVATGIRGERHEFEPVPLRLTKTQPAPDASPRPRAGAAGAEAGRRLLAFTNILGLGGAATFFFELVRRMRRLGLVDPTVVTVIDGPLRGELEADGIPVHILGHVPLDDADAYFDRIDELAAWAEGGGYEAVFVNTATGLTLSGADVAERLGLPAVWAVHESFHPALLWEGMAPELRTHARHALARASHAVFEAEATRRLYLDSTERAETINYGLDLEPIEAVRAGFDRAAARERAGVPPEAELVLCVGTIEPRKAQVPLTQAFELVAERHPHAHLAFLGSDDGGPSQALAARIEASPVGDRIRMVPRTRDVHPWYGMADLLVCASDIESLPRTVLEAMAWETPVLATAIFGLPELIEHGATGWLCEPGDVSALAEALGMALDAEAGERRRIGAAGRRLVLERHDLDTYARRFADLLAAPDVR